VSLVRTVNIILAVGNNQLVRDLVTFLTHRVI